MQRHSNYMVAMRRMLKEIELLLRLGISGKDFVAERHGLTQEEAVRVASRGSRL